jgi:hypothetical protein
VALFQEEEKIGVLDLGGRRTTGAGFQLERVLKGLGVFRSIQRLEYVCQVCRIPDLEQKCYSCYNQDLF